MRRISEPSTVWFDFIKPWKMFGSVINLFPIFQLGMWAKKSWKKHRFIDSMIPPNCSIFWYWLIFSPENSQAFCVFFRIHPKEFLDNHWDMKRFFQRAGRTHLCQTRFRPYEIPFFFAGKRGAFYRLATPNTGWVVSFLNLFAYAFWYGEFPAD